MLHDWRLYLDDIVESPTPVLGVTEGMTYEQFIADRRTRDATLHDLQIIGQASKKVPPEIRALAPSVDWKRVGDFRNRLVHAYFDLDDEIVWAVIQERLTGLLAEAERHRSDPTLYDSDAEH